MRKKITKRILALVLALALCTSLMLPGFAATKPTDSINHVHNIKVERQERYQNGYYEAGYHMVNVYYIYTCADRGCTYYYEMPYGEIKVSHPTPCDICRWGY